MTKSCDQSCYCNTRPAELSYTDRDAAPHRANGSGALLPYTRRIEGLLEPSSCPVLEGSYSSSADLLPLFAQYAYRFATGFRTSSNCKVDSWSGSSALQVRVSSLAVQAAGLTTLSSPGVHWLQDPRSRVYNFSPYLEQIPNVNDFAFERLAGFIKSSRDEVRGVRSKLMILAHSNI